MDSYLKYATLNVVVSGLRMVWYASLGRKACRRAVVNSQKSALLGTGGPRKCSFGDRGSPKARLVILDIHHNLCNALKQYRNQCIFLQNLCQTFYTCM